MNDIALRSSILVLVAGPAFAQVGTSISQPLLVNTNGASTTGTDQTPAVASNGGSVWLCAFATNEASLSNGTDFDIFWTQSRDTGFSWSPAQPVSGAFLTDSGVTSSDIDPAIAAAGGQCMVVWASTRQSSTGNYGIFSAYANPSNLNWVNDLPVGNAFASDSSDDLRPCIALGGGTFVTVWDRQESLTDRDLYFSRTTSSGGSTWSVPARVDAASATDTNPETNASIATDGAGNWVVVFQALGTAAGTGADTEIFAYRSSDDGLSWLGPTLVNATAFSDGGAADIEPSITVDSGSGTWVVVWKTLHTFSSITGGDAEIAISRSTNGGQTWSPVGIVNPDFATDQATSISDGAPHALADQNGRVLVCWTRTMLGGADTDLRVVRSDDLGLSFGPIDLPDTGSESDAFQDDHPQLATDGFGHWLTVWQTNDNVVPSFGTDLDIVSSRFLVPDADDDATFCFGSIEPGNGLRCPCGNDASPTSSSGCLNSAGTGGRLSAANSFNVSAATEVVTFNELVPGAAVLLFQGTGQSSFGLGIPFGDGRLCVAGTIDRLGVAFVNGVGNGTLTFVPTNVSAGNIRFYQGWYRDAAAFCTSSTFNLTNAFATVWQP